MNEGHKDPTDWSPAGVGGKEGAVLFISGLERDIWWVDVAAALEDGKEPVPFFPLTPDVHEEWPVFSPDGAWVAYASDDGRGEGDFEIYVRRFPSGSDLTPVTRESGGARDRIETAVPRRIPSYSPRG